MKQVILNLQIPVSMKIRVKALAKKRGISIAEMTRRLYVLELNNKEAK